MKDMESLLLAFIVEDRCQASAPPGLAAVQLDLEAMLAVERGTALHDM